MKVRLVEARDADAWAILYAEYREFYRLPGDPATVQKTWRWVRDGEHGLVGIVAVDEDDRPVALANLRWFARPSSATMVSILTTCSPHRRRAGVARRARFLRMLPCARENVEAASCGGSLLWTTRPPARSTTPMPSQPRG